ncbi:hypothetical protein Tco_1023889 [Tanacetum coccineum]
MADKEKKSTMKGFAANDQADYYSRITSITVSGKNAYELKGKFLNDLHKNSFSGTNREDAIEHIEYFLKIIIGNWEAMILSQQMKRLNLEDTNQDDEQEIDPDVLTNDIVGFNTYDEYKDDWIYEWNKNVPWVHEKPWTENGVWKEPSPVKHYCKPFNYKSGYSEWPTCSWKEDRFCNGGNLPGAYIVGNTLCYQDLEWYDALKDSKLKEEALRNKAIMEGLINEDVESNDEGWKSWDDFEITNGDRNEWEYENEHEDDERYELCDNETHELPVCIVRRFKMIKYSFRHDEKYVAIKEDEYEDLTSTSKDSCHTYQEIFRMLDEGWMVTRDE